MPLVRRCSNTTAVTVLAGDQARGAFAFAVFHLIILFRQCEQRACIIRCRHGRCLHFRSQPRLTHTHAHARLHPPSPPSPRPPRPAQRTMRRADVAMPSHTRLTRHKHGCEPALGQQRRGLRHGAPNQRARVTCGRCACVGKQLLLALATWHACGVELSLSSHA